MKPINFIFILLVALPVTGTSAMDVIDYIDVLVEQIDGELVEWKYIIMHDVTGVCGSEYAAGCASFKYRVMFIEEDAMYTHNRNGLDIFTLEYLHARCDYNGDNYHNGYGKDAIYINGYDYWNNCEPKWGSFL